MEVNVWIQQLVGIQVPELEDSKLDYIRNSLMITNFMNDMNNTSLFICFDKMVGYF
jgi:hypothetical protein